MHRRPFLFAPLLAPQCRRRAAAAGNTPEPPIHWIPPPAFDPKQPGLGLPQLPGVRHTVIYDPKPCRANLDEGGSGRYESPLHGTFNHHPQILLYQDRCLAHWTNHSRDENGPGQREVGRHGRIHRSARTLDWGGEANLVELAPAAVPVRRRPLQHDPHRIFEIYPRARAAVIDGKLYVIGNLVANHGWSDNALYHGFPQCPVPLRHWSDRQDRKAGFKYDVWWDLGHEFGQQWRFQGDRLEPCSPMYRLSEWKPTVEVADGKVKEVLAPGEPYAGAIPIARAPAAIRQDLLHGPRFPETPVPKYLQHPSYAADGKNALAHYSEFRRPDGQWVVLRDNLVNGGYYYASLKRAAEDAYPPPVRSNLYGHAMPASGELPGGGVWVLCNTANRYDMYLTVSRDGAVFDRSWLVLHVERQSDGGLFKMGGPQYFKTVMLEGVLWVVYSITKEQVGVSRIPLDNLPA